MGRLFVDPEADEEHMIDQPFPHVSQKMASRDHDIHKGAMEDERPSETLDAAALDDDGLPSDTTAIAQDAIGARIDGSQG